MGFQDLPTHLLQLAFKEDATAQELFQITLAFAIFWGIFFQCGIPILQKLTYGQPWLRKSCEREFERNGKDEMEMYGIKMNKEEAVEKMMKEWAWSQILLVQHVAGALLCVPSLLGLGGSSWANSLACCGVLSEMGWEIESYFELAYFRFLKPNGEKLVPNVVLVMMAVHHCLTTCLGLPMVLHYRGLRALHWICFDLQIGAACGALTEYSKMLDIKQPNDLRKFKLVNILLLAIMLWTRCIHWIYLCIEMVMIWYQDKAWTFLGVGLVMIALFSLFNAYCCVIPMYKRFIKFRHASADYESLPADASEVTRRQSAIALEDVVSEILNEDTINMEDQIVAFLDLLDKRPKLERRQTMPPRHRKTSVGRKKMLAFASAPADVWKED